MGTYLIKRINQDGPEFHDYTYAIVCDGEVVGEFGHDYRNDEKWLTIKGVTQTITNDLLEGGGPEPLRVSKAGSTLLDRLLAG